MDREIAVQLYDPENEIPPGWFKAMYEAVRKHSKVRNPGSTVRSIWNRLSRSKRAEIQKRESKGEKWDRENMIHIYDPGRQKKRHRSTKSRSFSGRPPKRWFYAMLSGIQKRSDVSPESAKRIVADIWHRLTPKKRADIKAREIKGEKFAYDLPLPQDFDTRGAGTVRVVKPFKLAEVQANVSHTAFARMERSGLFEKMKRQDGTTALVKRCKSRRGNCNIFIDRT